MALGVEAGGEWWTNLLVKIAKFALRCTVLEDCRGGYGGGLFRRGRFVRERDGEMNAARGTGSDAGTIVEPT
jgi:hypothetical protein